MEVESATSLFYQSDPGIWKNSLLPSGKLRQWLEQGTIAPVPYTTLSLADQADHRQLNEAFLRGGFEAPLNWYKSALYGIDKDHEAAITESDLVITHPVSFIVGENDVVGRPEIASDAAARGTKQGHLPDVNVEVINGTGHWMMLEQPYATFQALVSLANRRS